MPEEPKRTGANYSREELRRDMLRGVVTEPLLTHIRERPGDTYDQ